MPNASLPKPIAVSDAQMSAILAAAQPLQPVERSTFLATLARRLQNEPELIGDGALHRLIREVVRETWRPPVVEKEPVHHRRQVGAPIA